MGTRFKTFESTGLAPNGRVYAGDMNQMQDVYADLVNFSQEVDVAALGIGESALKLLRYGTGEARLSGALRVDAIIRALGGLYAGAFTTAQRDSIQPGFRPYGLIILNTTTNQIEWNKGTDTTPNWVSMGYVPVGGTQIVNADIAANAAISPSKFAGYPNDAKKVLQGDGSWAYPLVPPKSVSANYTLVIGDLNTMIEVNSASPTPCTIPSNAAAAFAIGSTVSIGQVGAGQVTITAAGGVTLRSYNNSLKLAGQWAVCSAIKRATDDWWVAGNLVP